MGVLAYDEAQPVGWCSVAPRQTYQKLERSRTMPRVTHPEIVTWSVLCFFVHRKYRGHQVASTLLEGAVAYALSEGAQVIEGYPFDSAGITATHRGHSRIFEKAGFQRDDNRWYLALTLA
ncbi:MAG: GNAT family N-acetyltransferase [Chloroflexota bacterium]